MGLEGLVIHKHGSLERQGVALGDTSSQEGELFFVFVFVFCMGKRVTFLTRVLSRPRGQTSASHDVGLVGDPLLQVLKL